MGLLSNWEGTCYLCGTEMSMSKVLYEKRIKDKRDFWCPNGHEQSFVGKNKEEKKIDELEVEKLRLKREIAALQNRVDEHSDFRCPMGYCSYSSHYKPTLRKHMESKHSVSFDRRMLPAKAGADAHGDMGIVN